MRVFLFFFISFILLSGTVSSQQFHGGVTAGIVGSQVAGDGYSGYKKGGIFAGGYVNLDVSERSAFQMELTFFQKGSRQNPRPEKDLYDNYLFRVNYIEMPFLYLFKIGRFIIEAGPSAGVLVSYYETDVNGYEISNQQGYNKPAALTLQINVGLRFFITQKLGANFRIHDSLLNIRSENVTGDVWRFWGYGQFNDALVLSFFYQFR
jgi:hypothetical protein